MTSRRTAPRKGRPLYVSDYHNVINTLFQSTSYSITNPAWVVTPIISLGSLLGSVTAAEYSQMQAFKQVLIGKLKYDIDILGYSSASEQNVSDKCYFAHGMFLARCEGADGTPYDEIDELNPFQDDIQPQGIETSRDPWGDRGLDSATRWLWIDHHILWLGNPQNAYCTKMHLRRRHPRGYKIHRQDALYYGQWFYSELAAPPGGNDTVIHTQIHAGVPRRFLTNT